MARAEMFAIVLSIVGAALPALASQTAGHCSAWCNVYCCTSLPTYCGGCSTCTEYEHGQYCAGWCTKYTHGWSVCSGCSGNGPPPSPAPHPAPKTDLGFSDAEGPCRQIDGGTGDYYLAPISPDATATQTYAECAQQCKDGCYGFQMYHPPPTQAQIGYSLSQYKSAGATEEQLKAIEKRLLEMRSHCEIHTAPIRYAQIDYAVKSLLTAPDTLCAIKHPVGAVSNEGDAFAGAKFGVLHHAKGLTYASSDGPCRSVDGGGGQVKYKFPMEPAKCQDNCTADPECTAVEIAVYTPEQAQEVIKGLPETGEYITTHTCEIQVAQDITFGQTSGALAGHYDYSGNYVCLVKVTAYSDWDLWDL